MAVASSPDGRLIASGDGDGGLLLWDAAGGRELARLPTGESAIEALAFASDGARLASGDGDGSVGVWDLSAGAERASLQTTLPGSGRVAALAFTDADSRLIIATGGGAARALDLADGTTHTLAPYLSEVDAVAMDRGGRLLALGIKDEVLGLVDLVDGADGADATPCPALPSIGWRIKALAVSDDGRLLAAAMQDGYVRLWDPADGRALARLAAGAEDGRLRLWDIAGGPAAALPLASVDTAGGQVVSLAFSGDGRRLAAGTSDGRARTFDLRCLTLLANGPAPSAGAALIEAALLRLWRLSPDGMDFADEAWPQLAPAAAGQTEARSRNGTDLPRVPAPAEGDKLDQVLDWLAAQGQT